MINFIVVPNWHLILAQILPKLQNVFFFYELLIKLTEFTRAEVLTE